MALRILIQRYLWALCCLPVLSFASQGLLPIGAGDTLKIDVYNESDLYVETKVDQSGIVRIALIGDIQVIGKTTKQLEKELEKALLDGYLVHPSVSVSIESYRPFYIRGAVKSAGSYTFELDLTVEQAIAIAGGLKDRASKDKWFIVRGTGKQKIQVDKDTQVMPGDIVTIAESIF